jgi:cytoskeletal protein CcmA (bactofilin family)
MFGNKTMPTSTPSGAIQHNSLVKGTVVKGDVKSEKDIRVEGTIEGNLTCDARLVIGPNGFIKGVVTCRDAVIEGKIEGDIYVTDLLNLRKSAQLVGQISTNKLIIEPGATFKGTSKMGKSGVNNAAKPANQQKIG